MKKQKNIHSKAKDNFPDLFELTYNNKFAKKKHEDKKHFKNRKKYPPHEDNDAI
jgi:hypothetical protein